MRDGAFILIAASAFCVRARAGFGDINVGLRCAKPTYNNGGHKIMGVRVILILVSITLRPHAPPSSESPQRNYAA